MPIVNRVADLHAEITAWRQDFHAHPELLYDVHRTAASVADKLKSFGCDEVVTGIGRTGVVGVIRGRKPGGKVVGLRADMDALPIEEETGLPYKSTVPGKMHACGHDGHTAMLLGAAKYLADTRNFAGTAVVIFQPAEEGGAGARAMLRDGLLDRFGIEEVFGMHNFPGMPVGEFAIRPGPVDGLNRSRSPSISKARAGTLRGRIWASTPFWSARRSSTSSSRLWRVMSIPLRRRSSRFACSRQARPSTSFRSARGWAVRCAVCPQVRELLKQRVREVVEGTAQLHGAKAHFTYSPGYPVLVNDEGRTDFAATVAEEIAGTDKVNRNIAPLLGAEDFAYMLQERPGAFIYVGNGDSAGLHHPAYDFDDDAIPLGTSYWVRLAETALAE